MKAFVVALIFVLYFCSFADAADAPLVIVPRKEWKSMPLKNLPAIVEPTPFVVIHHTVGTQACYTSADCRDAMYRLQFDHMHRQNFWDIKYNFCVGGDGKIYEGRGWGAYGTHTYGFGDYSVTWPDQKMVKAVRGLLEYGIRKKHLSPRYKVFAHLQANKKTSCPGDRLLRLVRNWKHWEPYPQ